MSNMSKAKILKKAKGGSKNMTEKRQKPASKSKKEIATPAENKHTINKPADGRDKVKNTQTNPNSNPFVDKYLEFYDDIKIPSRRYDR